MKLIYNIGLLATPTGSNPRAGSAQGEITLLKNCWLTMDEAGKLLSIGTGESPRAKEAIDAGGKLVTPGLVDAHTHLVFGSWRAYELMQKLQGVPYLEILASGGGILSTVRATRSASRQELKKKAAKALGEMLSFGTTTCECKSGYGLDLCTELEQLRVVRELKDEQPVELVSTYLGAHALPEEYKHDREGYLKLITDRVIPAVAEEKLAQFCDVFCEEGVFTAGEAEQVLRCGLEHGLGAKIHADEIHAIGGSQLAGSLGAVSAEHLIAAGEGEIQALAQGKVVAVLLPATSFYLDKGFARARDMVSAGVPVAVATDFNPGSCPGLNLQLAMNLACWKYRLTPEEVLTAVTLNAAAAIGKADTLGTLEPGKQADILIWDAEDLNYIFYRFGSNLVNTVIKNGKTVFRQGETL